MAATFRITCPYCFQPTRAPLEAFFRWWPTEGGTTVPEKAAQEGGSAIAAAASYCPECEGLLSLEIRGRQSLLRDMLSGEIGAEDYAHYEADLELVAHYPEPPGTKLPETVPDAIRAVFPDMLEDAARRRNAAALTTSCRGVLEVALVALETRFKIAPPKPNLISRIESLAQNGIITSDLADWAHQIRLDGNKSAHELIGDPDLAKSYVDFLKLFLEISFDLPERIASMKKAKMDKAAPEIRGKGV